jgi:hypothetical protein
MFNACLIVLVTLLIKCALLPAYAAGAGEQIKSYDRHLCRSAQRLLLNADDSLPVIQQTASGNGFHTIQMSIDVPRQAVVIAMTTAYTTIDGNNAATYVSCNMVDRDRTNEMLDLNLPPPDRQCSDANTATYALALDLLTPAQRRHYLGAGRQLQFADDSITGTGGEWLPITLDKFITTTTDNDLVIRSPSVRVPWNAEEQNFFQGTQHCKLITLAAMTRWMTVGAFDPGARLIPLSESECTAPNSMTSAVGSCLFYFAPADALFCQDYSGAGWGAENAQAECANRHASIDALKAAKNRYEGAGGIYVASACTDRDDTPAISGTCVFHCQADDETLWHVSGAVDPRMTKGCDLFVEQLAE